MRRKRNNSNIVKFRQKHSKPNNSLKILSNRYLQSLLAIGGFLTLAWVVTVFNEQRFEDRIEQQDSFNQHFPEEITGVVIRVIDGDGIMVGDYEIRLGDFDAPELSQVGGSEAKESLHSIAYGKQVTCTSCEGARNPRRCISYDRIIATCRIQGERIGDMMRANGIKEGGN